MQYQNLTNDLICIFFFYFLLVERNEICLNTCALNFQIVDTISKLSTVSFFFFLAWCKISQILYKWCIRLHCVWYKQIPNMASLLKSILITTNNSLVNQQITSDCIISCVWNMPNILIYICIITLRMEIGNVLPWKQTY